jgi:hypothetical protein
MIPADLLFLLFHMGRQSTAQRTGLRSDVPTIPPPPDRAQWEAEHREKPWSVGQRTHRAGQQLRLRVLTLRARRCIERDLATIDRQKAISEQVKLDHICERVKVAFQIPNGDHVFFDPSDNQFWVYPESVTR